MLIDYPIPFLLLYRTCCCCCCFFIVKKVFMDGKHDVQSYINKRVMYYIYVTCKHIMRLVKEDGKMKICWFVRQTNKRNYNMPVFSFLYNCKLKTKKKKRKTTKQMKKKRNENIINTSCDSKVRKKREYILA
jgi:hypothetical protein